MKRGILTVFICFLVMLISPATAKADLVFEPEDEISSVYGEENKDLDEESLSIPLIIGGLVLVLVIITGVLIWFFYGRKGKK